MNKYRLVSKKGEGTFSEVLKASSIVTGELFAIKCMKSQFKSIEQVNALREIQALKRLNVHPNIIQLEEILYDATSGRLALVFELMEMNVYEMIKNKKQPLRPELTAHLMYQLLKATYHMHSNGIFHRDIKPENLLISASTSPFPVLKIADFGSCRGLHTAPPHTEYISTRWYRAPECLLTNGQYDYKMDIWGIGAVFFEIVALFPLFPGTNELDQIEKIHAILGPPSPELLSQFKNPSSHMKNINFHPRAGTGIARLIPHASADTVDLITKLLIYDPDKRITAKQALKHPYFKECRDRERRERDKSHQEKDAKSASAQLQPLSPPMSPRRSAADASAGGSKHGPGSGSSSVSAVEATAAIKKKDKERDKDKDKEKDKDKDARKAKKVAGHAAREAPVAAPVAPLLFPSLKPQPQPQPQSQSQSQSHPHSHSLHSPSHADSSSSSSFHFSSPSNPALPPVDKARKSGRARKAADSTAPAAAPSSSASVSSSSSVSASSAAAASSSISYFSGGSSTARKPHGHGHGHHVSQFPHVSSSHVPDLPSMRLTGVSKFPAFELQPMKKQNSLTAR